MPPDAKPRDVVDVLATRLADPMLGNGPLAALRRMDPSPRGTLAVPALQRLLAQAGSLGSERGLALLVHVMALAAPGLHRSGESLGTALARAHYSEGRLARLLNAGAGDLPVVLPRMVRFMLAKGEALNPHELWRLIRAASYDLGALDEVRTRLARDYYRAVATTAPTSESPAS